MKKILSILIVVLLGVTSVWAASPIAMGKTTVKAIALNNGGEVLVEINQPTKYNTYVVGGWWSWSEWNNSSYSENGTQGTTSTGYGHSISHTLLVAHEQGIQFKLQAFASNGYYFDGWTNVDNLGGSVIISAEPNPTNAIQNQYRSEAEELFYYAIFKKWRYYNPTPFVLAVANGCEEMGKVSLDSSTWYTSIPGTDGSSPIKEGVASPQINYYAKPTDNSNYVFVGWIDRPDPEYDEDGNLTTQLVEVTNPFTFNPESTDEKNPSRPTSLYAVFREQKYYHHSPATVGFFATSEEGGYVYVTPNRVDSNSITSWSQNNPFTSTETGTGETLQDGVIKHAVDVAEYQYHYYAKNPDDGKAAFVGWSSAPEVMNVISTANPYSITDEGSEIDEDPVSPSTVYAIFQSFYYGQPAAYSIGGGKVFVGTENIGNPSAVPADSWMETIDNRDITHRVAKNGNKYDYSFYYYAQERTGLNFGGWSETSDGRNIISEDNPYQHNASTSAITEEDKHFAKPLYAVFQSWINILQQDRMICYVDDKGNGYINDARLIIELTQAEKLVANLTGGTEYFDLSNKSGTQKGTSVQFDATKGLMQLHLTYKGELNEAEGKVATIQLHAQNNGEDVMEPLIVNIVVEKAPIVTFLPSDGKGDYTIKLTDGSGIVHTMQRTATEDIQVAITNETMANIEMEIEDYADDDYIFFGWKKIENGAESYISYNTKCTYEFQSAVSVYPEFIPNNRATFIIKDDDKNMVYHDLQKALDDAAAKAGQQVVVFANAGRQIGVLPKGEYEIPANVTLLIPGNEEYTSRTEFLRQATDDNDYFVPGPGETPTCFRKLIVEDNTIIEIADGGKICLYSRAANFNQSFAALPFNYGQIELGYGSHIIARDGAQLFAWGFITNTVGTQITEENVDNVGRVTIESGAEVYELFQYSDFRGGTRTSEIYLGREDHKVFPLSQYYLQNIETPLIVQYGARECVSTGFYMSGTITTVDGRFIISDKDDSDGLFKLQSNAELVKYYDAHLDRQKYILRSMNESRASVSINYLRIETGIQFLIFDVNLDSREYVLPINNNMDFILDNVELNVPYNLAMLAGSTMHIKENCAINLNNDAFIYDADQNTGYFGTGNSKIRPIFYTPNGTHTTDGNTFSAELYLHTDGDTKINEFSSDKYKRKPANVEDAKLVLDGVINVNAGGFYTTTSGANITSTNRGKVNFNIKGSRAKTYQANNADWVEIGVTNAQLRNANGTYEAGNAISAGSKYTYNPVRGKWQTATIMDSWNGGSITITQPDQVESITHSWYIAGMSEDVSKYTVSCSSPGFTVTKGSTYSNGLPLTITYTAQNKAGEHVGSITISDGTNTYTLLVTAIEDYTPEFTVTNPFTTSATVGTQSTTTPFITAVDGNITELVTNENLVWTPEITGTDAGQFSFTFGTEDAKLTNSTLIFNPTSAGTKTATLTLTATYTDANDVASTTSVAVPLTGNATALAENNLAFADLSAIYVGQSSETNLFSGTGSQGTIVITITDEVNVDGSGNKLTVTEGEFGITNSNENSTIKPNKTGTYTIKAVQYPSSTVAGTTITKTITIHPRVKWNWENMYFGGTYTNPITFMDGNSPEYTLVETTDAQNVVNYDADNKTATISAWETGEAEATFTFTQAGYDPITFTSNIHRDPRRLRVDVNDLRTYKAVNADTVGVQFDNLNKTIVFTSAAGKTSQWTMYFIGVPDELYFTPTQCQNAWQIEESPNGTNWMTTFTWASIATNTPFSHSLLPTTRYLRITYGGANVESQAVLTKFYVTALTSVKADPIKLYMPTVATGGSTTKDIVFTYASLTSGLTLSTSDNTLFTLNASTLPATSETTPYQVQQVAVTSTSTTETTGFVYVKDGDQTLLEVPIQVYQYPQDLPILMASDPLERYYFVTEKTYRTTWEEKTRAIVMNNAVSNANPFVTFHFSDSPTPGLITFNHTENCKGTWLIEERANESVAWTTHYVTPDNTNAISQELSDQSRYVRVTYISAYAEVIDVTNLAIVPTANIKVTPAELTIKNGSPENVAVRANNLADLEITCTSSYFTWTPKDDLTPWVGDGTKEANLTISYNGTAAVEYATLNFYSTVADEMIVLATVELTGILGSLTNGTTNIYTGVHDGVNGTIISDATKYTLKGDFIGKEFKPIDISDAFVPSTSTPLFDYLFIFGETTTMDGTTIITTPNNSAGSNAKTPCYIYKKGTTGYDFFKVIDNANASTKVTHELDILQLTDNSAKENLKVYITGFCPYASTGYTKNDEGVFFFQGGTNDNVDVYLEDCYLYSRYKTFDGHSFINRSNGESYSESYVRGSGGVLVFECTVNNNTSTTPFNVTIHTKGRNVLKSHYGCFYESIVGRAYQVSSPVQIHMAGAEDFVQGSYTTLNFDDKWPTTADHSTSVRTNGFLSLQKQVNNAPSIDLGNPLTVVNFNGGRIELQNAQIVSTNYKTTMAISHRSGEFAGFRLSYGMGSDDAGGTVNFNDGTTTVQTMKVNPDYVNYYLMDEDDPSTPENESLYTSCLRCPAKTYVMGGSHCMMRACSEPTSKGGAPTDENGKPLGLYKYPKTKTGDARGGWDDKNDGTGLVTPTDVPNDYKVESVTPNNNATPSDNTDDYLNFWFTKEEESSVKPEVDQKLSFWKTCMPYIKAEYVGYTRAVGGPTIIERNNEYQTELISNFLYCQIDENISNVIRDNYYAPVKNPAPSGGYESIKPTVVGDEYQNYVETYNVTDPESPVATGHDFEVAGKMYYITTIPSADVWMTFTAPFDVEKVYVVEAFEESKLENYSNDRDEILKFQAIHNANFAAFFGVAMALGTDKSFDDIYEDYKGWARSQDNGELKRGLKELIHYYKDDDTPANWAVADYYLYKHGGTNWEKTDDDDVFKTDWHLVKKQDGKLMQKHHTYSMFFPYCMGCFDDFGERDFWDYWSGKFLVFESTQASESTPHEVKGSAFVGSTSLFPIEGEDGFGPYEWPFKEEGFTDNSELFVYDGMPSDESFKLTGNPTFSLFGTKLMNVYPYEPTPMQETFIANVDYDAQGNALPISEPAEIQPTESFLLGAELQSSSMIPAKISRNGEVTYAYYKPGDGTTTDTKTPTVGGGNDMFITGIAGGINISVAAPQMVCVVNATGHVLYNGYVTDNVNVSLPINGIYVVKGENEVQKIFF